MALLENEIFTFTWRIENFSMCSQQPGDSITSPAFVVEFLEKAEWKVVFYPRGTDEEDSNYVSCFLRRTQSDNYPNYITICFQFKVLSAYSDMHISHGIETETYLKGITHGYEQFACRDYICLDENGILQEDVLTIQCQMSRFEEEENECVVLESVDMGCWNSNKFSDARYCSARTRIKVSKKSFAFKIERFSALKPGVKLLQDVESSVEGEPSFEVAFCLQDEFESCHPCIEIRMKSGSVRNVFLRAKIKTVGAPKSIQLAAEDQIYFTGGGVDEVWRFPMFIVTKELMEKEYFTYTNDCLNLQCNFSWSAEGNEFITETISKAFLSYSGEPRKSCTRTDEYQKLFEVEKFSDVTLRAGRYAREFRAHKHVLAARSDVFSAMFESNMQEQQTGVVDIIDFDPNTVERLLRYLYTDVLEDLNPEDAANLYIAADKYNIKLLKYRCCCLLTSLLSVSSVCKILVLAEVHQDADLLEGVRNFIRMNANEIFFSQNWKELAENNSLVAAKTMLHVFNQKLFPNK